MGDYIGKRRVGIKIFTRIAPCTPLNTRDVLGCVLCFKQILTQEQ